MAGAPYRVVVVGAGASGTLATARLVEAAARTGRRITVDLVDPAQETGHGLAYATPDLRHLLNVPAGRMSALPHDGDDFVRWLSAREGHRIGADAYVPRAHYGAYLADGLARSRAASGPYARVRRRRERVVAAESNPATGVGIRVHLHGGGSLDADAVVLALGNQPPGTAWAPAALRASPRFVADPWQPGALAAVPADRDVLLVGTGLTMCDVARTLAAPGRTLHAVSRQGRLPQAHTPSPSPPAVHRPGPPTGPPTGLPTGPHDLARLKREVLRRVALHRRHDGDWRPAVDGLRPHTARLWQQLSPADRERFLTGELREWEVHRHRLPPVTHQALEAAREAGTLTVRAAEVNGARISGDGELLQVRLSDGRSTAVGAVVNCTGADDRVRDWADPLVRSLLDGGLAVPGPHGLGFDTAADGGLIPSADRAAAPVWTLGRLRRGNLWETTAIPEIRVQAAELAASLLGGAPVRLPA
ncbi:FAD/NAD(P)-binding protein [Streptomyces cyaneofuscatus]|uniref:FAD/NAD(P)-binding protein n=1 Tax=Streptomyces cyaneofuscatus TaxID=66883 RepID=UPI00366089DD